MYTFAVSQILALKSIIKKIYIPLAISIIMGACNPIHYIAKNEVYLKSNKVQIANQIALVDFLTPHIQQKANTRYFWAVKVKMQQYLMFNDSNITVRNNKKKRKYYAKNKKRVLHGKDTSEFIPVLGDRIKQIGEAPVIFDKNLSKKTIVQFKKTLFNLGFFHNQVSVDYNYNRDSNKVKVRYVTIEGPQFIFDKITIESEDTTLIEAIQLANTYSILHDGDPYNTDNIDRERTRFTTEMRNQGYFYFSKDFITYEVDSARDGNLVDLKIIIKNPPPTDSELAKSNIKYTIGEITINSSYNPNFTTTLTDTIHFGDLIYENLSQLKYNPDLFLDIFFLKKGHMYSLRDQDRTYSRVLGLNNFSYINIGFIPSLSDSSILNCNVLLTPLPTQTIGVEIEGVNSSSNLGVSGYFNYQNRNLFGNAEEFKIRFKGGVEAQQTNSSQASDPNLFQLVNTFEYGIESSLIFQKLLLPYSIKTNLLKQFNQPKTSLNFIINYQARPDFKRNLINISTGYFFSRKKENTIDYFIYPTDISFIRINKSAAFEERLNSLNNPLLNSTYDDQFILSTRLITSWSNFTNINQKSRILNRAQFEIGGNLISLLKPLLTEPEPNEDYYTVSGVRYAQFFKMQNDWSITQEINQNQSFAFKALAGIGVPYGNSEALPYDRSFYGGGANDNRGWRARTLGPGSLRADNPAKNGVDQVADIKLLIGAEYRFKIIKSVEGALFVDAGNIWLLKADPSRPDANFALDRFLREFAIAAGPGLRFNFGFLLIRFDWGFRLHDPAEPIGQRWIGQKPDYWKNYNNNSVFNLGIGYPF